MAVSGTGAVIAGRYRLVKQLAAGGMGTVWEAWDERLQRTVAVKQLHLQAGLSEVDREAAIQRAQREARLTARLHHPNAVQVFDIVDDDGHPSIVMQFVPSTSLQNIVRDRGPLPQSEVARIGTQVAAALAAAHRAGIVHRDVKPGNVLIAVDGTAKITDFGISHALDDVTVTSTGMVTGTPAYIAPEVARGAPSSFASDVYSLGATLYMAVEGRPPFGTDQNPMAVLHRVASGQPDPAQRAGALTPILRDMMSTDAGRRPDMVTVANALGTLRTDDAVTRPNVPIAGAVTELIPQHNPGPPPRDEPADATRALPTVPPPLLLPRPAQQPPPMQFGPPPVDERRHRSWVPIAAAAIVILLGTVLAIYLLSNAGTGGGSPSGLPTAPATQTKINPSQGKHSKSHHPKKSHHPTKTHSKHPASNPPSAPSTAPSTQPSTQPSSAPPPSSPPARSGPPSSSDLSSAITHYYSIVPGDLNQGWTLLTPSYQQGTAGGRGEYNKWWHSIDRVELTDVSGSSPGTADATITYFFKNGRQSTDRTEFGLVRQDGVLKINSSQVVG
jgi:serine/threonine protein kinase